MKASTYKRFKAVEGRLSAIESTLATLVTTIREGIKMGTQAAVDITREVGETKALVGTLIGKITDLLASVAEISQQLKDSRDAESAAEQGAKDLDQLQTDTQAFLAGLSTPPGGGTTPPPVTPLAASYPSASDFNTAVGAYTGPEQVTLDGAEVKAGTSPALAYFTQGDGTVSTTAPTVEP